MLLSPRTYKNIRTCRYQMTTKNYINSNILSVSCEIIMQWYNYIFYINFDL